MFTRDRVFLDRDSFPPEGALVNNLKWAVLYTTISLGLGLVIAILAARVRYEGLVKAIIFVPMAISATAVAIIWKFVYEPDPDKGVINAVLDGTFNVDPIVFLGRADTVNYAIIASYVWASAGFAMVVLSAALKGIPEEIIEAARTDGANEWAIFRRIQFPLLSLPMAVVTVWLTINVIKLFDIIYVLTRGGPGKRERGDRHPDVLPGVPERRGRLRIRDRDRHADPHPPADDLEHQPLPQRAGGHVSAAAEAGRQPTTVSGRLIRFISRTPVHLALLAIAVIWLVPTVGLAITSFRPGDDVQSSGWWTAFNDFAFTLHNYELVLDNAQMGSSFINSIIITVPSTLLPLFFGALAAYAFSWIKFPFRDTIFLIIVALMVVPIQMGLVPLLRLFRDLGIADWYVGIWIAHTAFGLPLAIFLLRNFFITLPRDLIEAARVDGASNLRIFLRVVLPLSVPALASYAIFQFLWVWNDLLMALVFITDSDLFPLTKRIVETQGTFGAEYHLLASGAFLLMIVPLIVFFALQRYFVQGLLAGSVK